MIESKRVLVAGGSLILAMPVLSRKSSSLGSLFKLGILALTWSSEHYHIDYVKSAIQNQGLEIASLTRIGHNVYEPLADYYIANRESLREKIIVQYPSFVENMLYRSILKMKNLSMNEVIDYVIIKAN